MSTPVFDISSYLASLLGQQQYIQNKVDTLNTEITNLSSKPQTVTNILPTFEPAYGEPTTYSQIIPSDAANIISSDKSQLPSLQTQLDQLKTQISSAQSLVNQQRDIQSSSNVSMNSTASPTVSSLGISLPNLSHYFSSAETALGNVPPLYLAIGGAALLLLILK